MAEPITTTTLEYAVNGGTTPGYISRPQREGRYPGIVLIQEWWGVDDHIKDVTDRFAGEGYVTLAPDLFHGVVTSEPDEAMKLTQAMDMDRAVKELNGAVAYLKGQPFTSGKVGTIGYCLGGGLSILTACRNPDLNACVVYYGGSPDPIDQVQSIACPVLGNYAELDEGVNATLDSLKAAMERYGKSFEMHMYQGAHHGFFNDSNPSVYSPEAAPQAWERTLAFFKANLS